MKIATIRCIQYEKMCIGILETVGDRKTVKQKTSFAFVPKNNVLSFYFKTKSLGRILKICAW